MLGNLVENDISVKINGPLSPYNFDFSISPATGYVPGSQVKSFLIQLNFKSSLYGGLGGKLSIINNHRRGCRFI